MKREDLNEHMDAFERRFLGDIPPVPRLSNLLFEFLSSLDSETDAPEDRPSPEPARMVDGHDLLYDFENRYPDVRFTTSQVLSCLQAFLELVSPLTQALENESNRALGLYNTMSMSVCETLLAYFARLSDDEPHEPLTAYIKEVNAAEQLHNLLTFINVSPEDRYLDGYSRLESTYYTVAAWAKR